MFTKQDIETYLGHPVSDSEESTINAYIDAAQGEVEKILGFPIVVQTEAVEASEGVEAVEATTPSQRTFKKRANRHTIFTPPFTDATEVKYNGDVLTEDEFDAMYFDDYDASFFNSIVLEEHYGGCEKLLVTAKWGFPVLPADLKTAWFQYAMDLEETKRGNVSSESVGSYSVAYRQTSGIVGQPYLVIFQNYSVKGL